MTKAVMTCYTAAIPFFQRGLVSDLMFSAVFFSIPALIASATRMFEHKDAAI